MFDFNLEEAGIEIKMIDRYVLAGEKLEPGALDIDDSKLKSKDVLVEIRRNKISILPISEIKTLVKSCRNLILDPQTKDHKEVFDCLILGAENACIRSDSPKIELQLAHAASSKVITTVNLDELLELMGSLNEIYEYLLKLSTVVARKLMIRTIQSGLLHTWWENMPINVKGIFDWIFCPGEGKIVSLSDTPVGLRWCISSKL